MLIFRWLIVALLCTIFSCANETITEIDFERKEYFFAQKIESTFLSSGDIFYAATSFDMDDDYSDATPLYVLEVEAQKDKVIVPTRALETKLILTDGTKSLLVE